MLEGGAGRGAGTGSSAGRVRWKGPPEGGSSAGRGSSAGSSKGFKRRKGFQQGVPARVLAVPPFPFVTDTMEKAVAALVGSIPQLKPYTAIKGKARAERRHHIQAIMRELLVDLEAVVVEGGGGLYIRFAGHDDDEDPRVVHAIGLWATSRTLKLSMRHMLPPPRECTRRDLDEARTRLTPYSTTTYAIIGPNMIQRRCASTATLEDLVFTQLQIPKTQGELQVETEKIWILICPDATSLWHTSVTKIDVLVNYWASGFSAAGNIHKWVMWVYMDGPDDAAWLQALDEDAGLNAQIIHLQESCTFRVKKRNQKVSIKTDQGWETNDGDERGGEVLVGPPRCHRVGPIEGTVNKVQWGAFLRSVCIRIGDYAYTGCRVTNAFKKS